MNTPSHGILMERKPDDIERIGRMLGHAITEAVHHGQRSVYGGHTLTGLVQAAAALGVDAETDCVSVEMNVGVGGTGFYVVDEVGGVKELREVCL